MTTEPGQTRPAEAATTAAAKPGPSAAAKTSPAPRPGIQALIDNATSDRLYGWAWSPTEPERRLTVELRLADSTVASTTADLARPDLAGNGVGDGCHAFEFPLRPEWIERRGELSAVVRDRDGAEVPVAVRVRRPDDAKVSTHLQRGLEKLSAEHAALRRELAALPDPASALRERLDQLELWISRLDAKLGEGAAAGAPAARGGKDGGGGLDPWQAVLMAVLASAASAALALAAARFLGLG